MTRQREQSASSSCWSSNQASGRRSEGEPSAPRSSTPPLNDFGSSCQRYRSSRFLFSPSRRPLNVSISGSSFAARRACVSRTTRRTHFTPSEKHFLTQNDGPSKPRFQITNRISSQSPKKKKLPISPTQKNKRGRRSKPGWRSGFVRRRET